MMRQLPVSGLFDRQNPVAKLLASERSDRSTLFSTFTWSLLAAYFLGFGLLMGHFGDRHALQESSPAAFRAMVVERTAGQLEAARLEAARRLETQTGRLIKAMSHRAQASFAPWMYDYGQSVKLDLSRAQSGVSESWGLPGEHGSAFLTPEDIALVKARYGAVVATQRHFQNMMALLQRQAREYYRQDVGERLRVLRAELDLVPGTHRSIGQMRRGSAHGSRSEDQSAEVSPDWSSTEPYAAKLRWADQYFAKLEQALRTKPARTEISATGMDLVYYTSFLSSIPKLASKSELPDSLESAISSAQSEPDKATSTAALLLTWYVANLKMTDSAGMAKLATLLDQHFDSLLNLVLRDPHNGLVARLKVQHAELLEMSKVS